MSRASDDSAGLAIASGLSVDSRVFSQAVRNLSDGVSVTNIGEGALNELTNIVTRLQELAEQAANGTLGTKQRGALDAEAQALAKEYFRIARTTEFNGLTLFDGSVQGLSLHAGYGTSGILQASLGGKLGTGELGTAAQYGGNGLYSTSLGDLNADGALDIVTVGSDNLKVLIGNGDGTFGAASSYGAGDASWGAALGDVNGDGLLDIISADSASASASVLIGNGDGSFKARAAFTTDSNPRSIALGDLNGDGTLDIVTANNWNSTSSVLLGNGDGTFRAKIDLASASSAWSVALGDLNGDGFLDITATGQAGSASVILNNGNGTFSAKTDLAAGTGGVAVALGDLNGDGTLDIVSANGGLNSMVVSLGNGNGTFKARSNYVSGLAPSDVALGDLNGDGKLDIASANETDNTVSVLLGNGDGSFRTKNDFGSGMLPESVSLGDLNADGVLDAVTVNFAAGGKNSVLLGQTRDGISPLLDFSLKTKADAKWALELMKQKLSQLSRQRGIIGSNQSRLATAVANLQVERENYETARSRITDADVAEESSQLLKTRILQQAGSAVLAQANASPALALDLLEG